MLVVVGRHEPNPPLFPGFVCLATKQGSCSVPEAQRGDPVGGTLSSRISFVNVVVFSVTLRNQESHQDLEKAEVMVIPGWSFHAALQLHRTLLLSALPGCA